MKMRTANSLREVININTDFKTAINLYLHLNNADKVLSYIPTRSSLNFLSQYLDNVANSKEQSTLLVGPYGKGKSHLLLVLLAILSMDRNAENSVIVEKLINKIKSIDDIGNNVANQVGGAWKRNRMLPVLITDTTGDLNQAFLYAMNEALKSHNLTDLVPDTYYSIALERLDDWENNYPDTFGYFQLEINKEGQDIAQLKADLCMCNMQALDLFKRIYPKVTAGSEFNPMVVSEVLPLYKNICEKLVEEYNYSGIYIVFDEFSKFIESQSDKTTGNNMKLIQSMCELANDSKEAPLFFTMVAHKSIKEYGKYLSQDIINSFTGIEGRITEKYFITSSKNNYELIKNAIGKYEETISSIPCHDNYLGSRAFDRYYSLPVFKTNFLESEFEDIVLMGCYPLNPIAAYLLLNISEKVAQNERTLFTYISNDEPNSLARYVANHSIEQDWSIGADMIYDYFAPIFKKDITNEYIHNIWLSAEYSLEKCATKEEKRLIKALAAILIINNPEEMPATDSNIKMCVDIVDFEEIIKSLVSKDFIHKKNLTGAYAFKTRAGSELKAEIKKQSTIKGNNINYSKTLAAVTGKYYVLPRRYNTINMMTRYFENEFMDLDDFLRIDSADILLDNRHVDGIVINIYSHSVINQKQVAEHLCELADSRIIVCCPKRKLQAYKEIKEYEIIEDILANKTLSNYDVIKREIPLLLEDLSMEIESKVTSIYDDSSKVYYFDGLKVESINGNNAERAVNICCEKIYCNTPIINNEMVNRSVINTAQTRKTRINIINTVLSHLDDDSYYIGTNQEASVYRSLFKVTGIKDNNPTDNIKLILDTINLFINSCSDEKVSVVSLMDTLLSPPFGMRKGVIPFYVAYVIANRMEDIIVYFADKEVQLDADIIVNMCEQPANYALYVSKSDLQKEKYLEELNTLFNISDNRNLTENRIKNILICMQRWYRALPQASRNMINLEDYVPEDKTQRDMKVIKSAMQKVEYNPFEILFLDFPKKFNTNSLEETFNRIDMCKTYFDDYFQWIEQQAIDIVYDLWDPKRKEDLYHVLKQWHSNQSRRSRQDLHQDRLSNFMECLDSLDAYSNQYVLGKIVKALTNIYIDNWNGDSLDEFAMQIRLAKAKIEATSDELSAGEYELSFVDRRGERVEKLYSYADENTGSVLRNIIEDTLDEYDDLSVNDRVSILLEMIGKIIK